jgi:hypothetical protein
LALAFGVFQVVGGFSIAFGFMGPAEQALHQYFPADGTTGSVIDDGLRTLLFALVLGVLVEISFGLRNLNK